jgi:tetratricopeptide (TPR) repeat protein
MIRPVAGTPDLITLWTQVVTSQEQDAGKAVSALEAEVWRRRRVRLMETMLKADLEPSPEGVLAWHGAMVGAYELAGPVEAAHWHLNRLLAARPTDWSLHARRGGILHRAGRDEEAVSELGRAVELGGLAPVLEWCATRGEAYERCYRDADALWYWARVASATPSDPDIHDSLGRVHVYLNRLAEAEAHFARAVALAPDRPDLARHLALARIATGDRDGYRAVCARLLEGGGTRPTPATARLIAATCLLDPQAVTDWNVVLRLAERAAEGYEGDGRLVTAALYRAGRSEEALAREFRVSDKSIFVAWEWMFQGLIRLRTSHRDDALSILDRPLKWMGYLDTLSRDLDHPVWFSDWEYWAECHAIRPEVDRLLLDTSFPADPFVTSR